MLRHNIGISGSIRGIKLPEGETIESKINRIVNNREPIRDGAPIIYMDRSEGVSPSYDIRTDRFDIALDAVDKITALKITKREERIAARKSTQGTEPGPDPAA